MNLLQLSGEVYQHCFCVVCFILHTLIPIYVLYMCTYIHTYVCTHRVSISERRLTGVVTGSVSLPSESPSKSMYMQKVLTMTVGTYIPACRDALSGLACINCAWHLFTRLQWAGETSSAAEDQRCSEMMSLFQPVEVSRQRGLL